MEIIVKPVNKIEKQVFNPTANYRYSKYIITEKLEESSYAAILNTINDCVVIIDTENLTEAEKLFLIENWFFVEESFNEFEFAKQYKNAIIDKNYKKTLDKILSFTILTTTDCNANCFYCYEFGARKLKMTPKIANDTADFIIKQESNIHISWFGGEPLYNEEVISIISNKLIDNNVKFTSCMVSNGYLFDESKIDIYKNIYKLQDVQITLDGINDYYNTIKNFIYKDDKNPFEKVINNIKLLINNGIYVNIRLNIGLDNTQELKDTIDYLYTNIGKHKNLSIYCAMLYDNFINNDPAIFKNRIEIETYLLKKFNKGLEINPMYKENACMIDSNKSVVINPLGNFSLCEHMVDNNIVGNIYAGILDQNEVNKYKEKRFIKNECEKCIFYPLCISPIYCQLSNNCNLQRMELNKEYIKLCLYVKLKCYIKRK